MWIQKAFELAPRGRGFHLITDQLLQQLPELRQLRVGVLHLFIKHTSASLTINENADPTVRHDFENHFNRAVPEGRQDYLHRDEGPDDLPAHIKSSILGSSVSIPITQGHLNMGIWQGVYLCEHRDYGGCRTVVATVNGESD
ncbi:MAG: secondary thiamine-phosphate synthase enzyme YjbQ [Motiliproteus sp.]